MVSVCQAGTLVMWMVDSGQKVKQFNQVHGNSEVTCLAQDQSQTRLYTGSTDGTVKVRQRSQVMHFQGQVEIRYCQHWWHSQGEAEVTSVAWARSVEVRLAALLRSGRGQTPAGPMAQSK